MCLDLIFNKIFPFYYGIIMTMVIVAKSQHQSPCPRTFQYERDPNGDIYGAVGVYSFQENVDLMVELSVGNAVQGYNGRIELATPKNQVIDTIRSNRPIKYKVFFPRWINEPPRVTKIILNGQTVCTGSAAEFNAYSTVLSTITLSHRFGKSVPLSYTPPQNDYNQVNPNNPFFNGREPSGSKNPFLTNGNRPPDQNVFIIKDDNFDVYPPSTGSLDGSRNPVGVDVPYSDNPFFNGKKPPTSSQSFPKRDPPRNPSPDPENPFFNGKAPPASPASPPKRDPPRNPSPDHENPFFNIRGSSDSPPSPPKRNPPRKSAPDLEPLATPPPKKDPPRTPSRSSLQSTKDICGFTVVPNPLIVNGKTVPYGAFPWLAAMFASTGTGVEYRCCGSLVSHKHIVTAAHCVQRSRQSNSPISPDKLLFVLGKHNIENILIRDGEQMVGAEEVKIHPQYARDTSDADIAVVIISREIVYTNYIRPICIWSESQDIDDVVGQKGKVVGWGRDETNMMSSEPKQVSMSIVSQEECLRSAEVFKYITSNRSFCAGERDNTGPCNGDSGSGFIMKRNTRWNLRGVVSISTYDTDKQFCDLSNYVTFTDVSKFRTWLLSIIVI